MWRDKKTGMEFAGSDNVWLKRLGLFIVIVGCFGEYLLKDNDMLVNILLLLVLFTIITFVIKFTISFLKSFF